MVVCKYYLQGNCRFGENCKFLHQASDSSGSILKQQNFNMSQTNVDTNTLVRSLTNDMVAAEKGGQWLLSNYAPFRDKPSFPGFEDQSFEEVRLGFYEAQRNGTVEQYKQQLQGVLQEAIMRIRALQNPSPEVVNILKQIYNSPSLSSSHNNQGANLNFTGTQNQGSIFGGQPQAGSSIFGQSQSVFGGSNQQNIFGPQAVNQPTVTQTSVFGGKSPLLGSQANQGTSFGGQNQNPIFGGQQPSVFSQQSGSFGAQTASGSSIFAAKPFTNTAQSNVGNVFGQPQQQNTGNSFGQQPQQQNIFGQQNQSIFGQQQSAASFSQQQNTSIFNQPSQSNIFGQQPPTASVFGQPQQTTSVFNQPQPLQNVNFNSTAPQQTASIFAQPQNSSIFGQFQQHTTSNMEQQGNSPLAQQNASPFNQQTSVFNQQNTMQSVFGQQPSQNTVFKQQSQSTFNNNNNQNIFGASQNTQNIECNEGVYSKPEDLSENDMKCFESDDFQLGSIPEIPPTLEMCH